MAQSLSVTISDINKDLKKKESQFAKAINATTSDCGRRGQGWVSQEVRKVYGTDLKTIKSTYKGFKKDGKIKVLEIELLNIYQKEEEEPIAAKVKIMLDFDMKFMTIQVESTQEKN